MDTSRKLLSALGLAAAGCVHPGPALHGPEDVVRSYARALEAGKLDEAWALSTPLDREVFERRYQDPAARHLRAEALERAAGGETTSPLALEAGPGQGWRVIEAPVPSAPVADEEQARALVGHFLAAARSGDFEGAWGDLAASWRARYTPGRLKADFEAEPAATERLARIQAALGKPWELTPQGPQLPLGEGRRLKLQREGAGFKVVALE